MRRVARVLHEVIAHFLAMDGILSNKDNPKTTPKSTGKYCAAVDCKNSCYDSHGHRTRYHFFRFPKKIKQRNRWCNLIKRQHGKDGFSVNSSTVVCSEHFKKEDIIRKLGFEALEDKNVFGRDPPKLTLPPWYALRSAWQLFSLNDPSLKYSCL